MTDTLVVLLSGSVAGRVERRSADRGLVFEYDTDHAAAARPVPLSVSMPVDQRLFEDSRVDGWMSGLLPGHPAVRADWANRYGSASTHPFDLLGTRVGLECAGAVQFCKPEALAAALSGRGDTNWLTPAETTEMIAEMVRQATLWGRQLGHSAFSLAGAHAKVALYRDDASPRRWGETHGAPATTHILKPAMPGDPEQSINEHLCMTAARHSGLTAAETELQTWGEHTVLVARRFDRVRGGDGEIRRVHQEDMHQAAGDYTASIYQGDGEGHTPSDIADLLTAHASDPGHDKEAFFDALAYNWLICNTDAHSKNYSFLIGPGRVRLAPLYDVWSVMPKNPDDYRAHTLAMSALADRRILAADNPQAWEATAASVGIAPSEGLDRVERIIRAGPAAIERAIDEMDQPHRGAQTVSMLAAMAKERSVSCLDALALRSHDGGAPGVRDQPKGRRPARAPRRRPKRPKNRRAARPVCGAWMPVARARCILTDGHRGPHRSKRS